MKAVRQSDRTLRCESRHGAQRIGAKCPSSILVAEGTGLGPMTRITGGSSSWRARMAFQLWLAPEAANRAKPSRLDPHEPRYLRKRCWTSHWIEHDAAVAGRDTLAVDSRHRGLARFAYEPARRSCPCGPWFRAWHADGVRGGGQRGRAAGWAADRHAAIIAGYALPEGLGPDAAVTVPARPLGVGSF